MPFLAQLACLLIEWARCHVHVHVHAHYNTFSFIHGRPSTTQSAETKMSE